MDWGLTEVPQRTQTLLSYVVMDNVTLSLKMDYIGELYLI